ncbi:hypothetical protein C8R45DRAFT_942826 [Mycena sanguinolenta]|nr:hypothetical protein C8R45DRAFT_942826 [Mycena sanguinolenta]
MAPPTTYVSLIVLSSSLTPVSSSVSRLLRLSPQETQAKRRQASKTKQMAIFKRAHRLKHAAGAFYVPAQLRRPYPNNAIAPKVWQLLRVLQINNAVFVKVKVARATQQMLHGVWSKPTSHTGACGQPMIMSQLALLPLKTLERV